MNNNDHNTTVHEFDFNLIGDYFRDLPRQGPGSDEATLLALQLAGPLPADARIADLGCGTGAQTMALAAATTGHITAIDLMPSFVENLREQVKWEGLQERIEVVEGSMDDLPFAEGSLDLIWAEGSIAHAGFRRGLELWSRYLKPGGAVAVSEATWFTRTPHPEIYKYWMDSYTEIDTIPAKVAAMAEAGYLPTAHFALPEKAWRDYYAPQPARCGAFLDEHGHSPAAKRLVEMMLHEIELYDRHHADYGYVFYIGRKPL